MGGTQRHSMALNGTQRHSVALSGTAALTWPVHTKPFSPGLMSTASQSIRGAVRG